PVPICVPPPCAATANSCRPPNACSIPACRRLRRTAATTSARIEFRDAPAQGRIRQACHHVSCAPLPLDWTATRTFMTPSIRRKLEQLAERHQELELVLASAEVAGDAKRLRELSREHARLAPLSASLAAYDANLKALT